MADRENQVRSASNQLTAILAERMGLPAGTAAEVSAAAKKSHTPYKDQKGKK